MAFKFLQNHPILALSLALLFAHEILYTAFAASVGRMGGSSFASEKESSSYSSSNIYHYIYHFDNNPTFSSGYVDRFVGICLSIAYLNRASVLRVQVGLSGMAHSIQRELSTLATAVDTSKSKSFHFFLTDSAVALLRHQNYWISGYSSESNILKAERRWSLEAVEKEFRLLSINERLKYDIESLVNVDNMKVQRTIIPRDNEVEENYTVAVEVLWSPQAEHDTLSVDELLEKYLVLRPI